MHIPHNAPRITRGAAQIMLNQNLQVSLLRINAAYGTLQSITPIGNFYTELPFNFAREVVSLKGLKCEVLPIESQEYPASAKRPHYSVLDNYMLRLTGLYTFADWEKAIALYLS